MEELQAQIIANDKSVKSAIVSPATFHLTMMVIDLQADHHGRSAYSSLPFIWGAWSFLPLPWFLEHGYYQFLLVFLS